ncbi:MAG TPA: NAD-dependent epimerase/dehydratase family protein [Solirubrobacteraceae bacterium]
MKVLVTGGAGFIGSHVVDCLRAHGITPRILDVRQSPHHPASEVDRVVVDLLDLDAVEAAMKGCDAVVHLAAAADVDEVAREPAHAEAVNARGTLNVLEAARRAGVNRVVYASTIWVYGNRTGTASEDDAFELPDHLYTATKLAGEMYCRSYAELYGVECTVLRFGIPYGPRARPAGVIPLFVTKALAGEPLTIAGEGLQSRRFVYVEDLADGVVRALCAQTPGRTYNLVGEESVTIRAIADTVCHLVGGASVVHTPARTADFQGAEVCGERAARELGWRPQTSFAEGVERYLEWHLAREVQAPASAAAPVARARVRHRPSPQLVMLALTWLTVVAVAGMLAAYLAAVHAIGQTASEDGTIAVLSVALLAGYLAIALDGPLKSFTTFAGWAVVATGLVVVYMPELRETLGLAGPDESRVLLGMAGGALAIGLADAGLRLRRSGEARLAADSG